MSDYTGNQNKIVNSQYLYQTLQQFKTNYTHTHANQSALDTITSEKITAWDNASSFTLDFETTALDLSNLT